jgi:hypothetical protein
VRDRLILRQKLKIGINILHVRAALLIWKNGRKDVERAKMIIKHLSDWKFMARKDDSRFAFVQLTQLRLAIPIFQILSVGTECSYPQKGKNSLKFVN